MYRQKQKSVYYLNFLFIVLSFFLFISCGSGEGSAGKGGVPAGETDQESRAVKSPFFWKVEKEGKVSYLLGAYHYGVSVHELLCSEVILEKLHGSDLLFLEAIQADTITFPQKIDQIQKGIAPEGNEKLFSPDFFLSDNTDFQQLSLTSQEFILQKNLPKNLSYSGFKRGLVLMCVKEIVGTDITISMDQEIEDAARNQQIPLRSLDKNKKSAFVEFLIAYDFLGVFTIGPNAEDVEQAVETYPKWCNDSLSVKDSDFKNGYTNPHVEAYRDKNILELRNKLWLSKFMSAHEQYDHIFLIGGNSHFISQDNLIGMLRSEGFSVERVSCQ